MIDQKNITRLIFRIFVLFYFLFLGNSVSAAADLPNLALYHYPGWSDKIVVSSVSWTITDTIPAASDPAYITVMIANLGSVDAGSSFLLSLYLDDQLLGTDQIPAIKASDWEAQSYYLGKLCVGSHAIRVELDASGVVTESDESDNSYTRTINITEPGTDVGSIQICPSRNDFGGIVVSKQGNHKFLVTNTNTGCDGLDITGMSISSSDSAYYSILSDTCSGKTLSSVSSTDSYASTCTIEVSFAPDLPGNSTAYLNIQSSDLSSPNYQIPLAGTGVPGDSNGGVLGDFDGSGRVSIDDVIPVLQLASGSDVTSNLDSKSDINGDGRIGLEDVVYVIKEAAQRGNSPLYEIVRIRTGLGEIMIWLYDQTPLHRDNFLSLVKQGFYDGLIFHRVIDGFMIQGGDPLGTGSGGPGYTIPAEITSSLTHVYGAVAAARLGYDNPEKRSSGSQFYIVENLSGAPFLDMNYTVFGQVISCMGVAEAIATVPKNSSDKPLQDVVMNKVEVIQLTDQQLLDQYGFTVPGP